MHAHRPQGEALDGGTAGRPHRSVALTNTAHCPVFPANYHRRLGSGDSSSAVHQSQGRIQGGPRASHQEGASHQFAAGALFNLSVSNSLITDPSAISRERTVWCCYRLRPKNR